MIPEDNEFKSPNDLPNWTFTGSFIPNDEIPSVTMTISEDITFTITESKRSFEARKEAQIANMYSSVANAVKKLRAESRKNRPEEE